MENQQQSHEKKLEDFFSCGIKFEINKVFESIPGTSAKPKEFGVLFKDFWTPLANSNQP